MNEPSQTVYQPDRLPWHWHDAFGRIDGQGPVPTWGHQDVPTGQCNRFSFAISDAEGFVVAYCTNALITMSSERSEMHARLFAAAPYLLEACKAALQKLEGQTEDGTLSLLRAAIARTEKPATSEVPHG